MRVQIWLKSFIPKELYTDSGRMLTWRCKMLELFSDKEGLSLLPLLTLFPYLLPSYTTDQRDFSSDITASARLTTVIDIPDHNKSKVNIHHYSNSTHEVHGDFIDHKTCKPEGKEMIKKTDDTLHISFSSSAYNPFFKAFGRAYAPRSMMKFHIELDFSDPVKIAVNLKGRVSQFPAFEAYLQMDEQMPVCLFQHAPAPGNTHLNLLYGSTNIARKLIISRSLAPTPPPTEEKKPEVLHWIRSSL
jgi:hypothetical protein